VIVAVVGAQHAAPLHERPDCSGDLGFGGKSKEESTTPSQTIFSRTPLWTVLLLVLAFSFSFAQDANQRANNLGKELRCPVCRGVPIAESPSEFARSMMNELRDQIRQGRTDDQIRTYFVTKYGQDILLVPPKSGASLIVWLGPIFVVALGAAGLWSYLGRASRAKPAINASPESLERVRRDLEERKSEAQ
jgi:cytochrome c-type biogenesis protein CcmH